MVTDTTPSLTAYRSQHKIAVDDSGPLPVCAVDSIRIHPTRVGGWFHDQATIIRLHREDVRRMVEQTRVSETITAITSEFEGTIGYESRRSVGVR